MCFNIFKYEESLRCKMTGRISFVCLWKFLPETHIMHMHNNLASRYFESTTLLKEFLCRNYVIYLFHTLEQIAEMPSTNTRLTVEVSIKCCLLSRASTEKFIWVNFLAFSITWALLLVYITLLSCCLFLFIC